MTNTTKTAQLPELSPIAKLLAGLDAATISGLSGDAAAWFKEAIRSGLQTQLGTATVTDADIDAGIKELDAYNAAAAQAGMTVPRGFAPGAGPKMTAPAKTTGQAAQQLKKRFGGGAK